MWSRASLKSLGAAFSAGVPVVPMAYSRKFNGLFIDTLSYSHLIDLKEDDEKAILTKVEEGFSNRDSLQQEIADRMGISRVMVYKHLAQATEQLKGYISKQR